MGISLRDLEYGRKTSAGSFEGDRDMGERVVALVREFTGREIDCEHHTTADGLMMLGFALADEADNPLTIPEKAVVAAFAWYCREYTAGLKRNAKIAFPKVIHAHSDETARNFMHHLTFASEERAYMFAEVAERCFGVNAQVVETPAGWAVVASYSNGVTSQTDDNGISAEKLAMLQGARRAWHDRKDAPLARIEGGINEVLARLKSADTEMERQVAETKAFIEKIPAGKPFRLRIGDAWVEMTGVIEWGDTIAHFANAKGYMTAVPLINIKGVDYPLDDSLSAATGAKTPSTATEHRMGRGLDALIPSKPTSAGKKSSAKRSA